MCGEGGGGISPAYEELAEKMHGIENRLATGSENVSFTCVCVWSSQPKIFTGGDSEGVMELVSGF